MTQMKSYLEGRQAGLMLLAAVFLLAACEGGVPKLKTPNLSLSRATPAPLETAPLREGREAIPPSGEVEVRAGDTLFALATRYQVTPDSIIQANDLVAPFQLTKGQRLQIQPARIHVVRPAESLFSLSQRYAVSQYQLAQLNGLSEPYELVAGQRLQLPDSHDFSVLEAASPRTVLLARPARPGEAARPAPQPKQAQPRKSFVAPKMQASDGFDWPVAGEILADFGPAERGVHNDGIDIAATEGTPVATAAPGTVAYVGTGLKSFGTLVLVKHDGGYITAYAHLGSVAVTEGQVLNAGQMIGQIGMTGRARQPSLHFEIRQGRTPVNPRDVIES